MSEVEDAARTSLPTSGLPKQGGGRGPGPVGEGQEDGDIQAVSVAPTPFAQPTAVLVEMSDALGRQPLAMKGGFDAGGNLETRSDAATPNNVDSVMLATQVTADIDLTIGRGS